MAIVEQYSGGAALFEFEMAEPLFAQMSADFDALTPQALTSSEIDKLQAKSGLYGLYLDAQLVYVGKADKDARTRLRLHLLKIEGRTGLDPKNMSFKCLQFASTWDAFKPETHLIKREKKAPGAKLAWNGSGFGSNEPGQNRKETVLKPTHWHMQYPLNAQFRLRDLPAGEYAAADLLKRVKKDAPFWFKYQGHQKTKYVTEKALEEAREDFERAEAVVLPQSDMDVVSVLRRVIEKLPTPLEWQLTQTPSHLYMFKELGVVYKNMTLLWPDE